MLTTFLFLSSLLLRLLPTAPAGPTLVVIPADPVVEMHSQLGLDGVMPEPVFRAAYERLEVHDGELKTLAIADMTLPSTEKRLYLIDLASRRLVKRTLVAHGQGTGELMAEDFSNRHGSHQTSLGLYRVGVEIVSPKHGPALLLHGLDPGLNDQALAREVIIHGADYVSEDFIAQHGRLGRSWGCPAVERTEMQLLIDLLADGGLLYVHGQ